MSDLLARNQRACTVQARKLPRVIFEEVFASVLQRLANAPDFQARALETITLIKSANKTPGQEHRSVTQVCEFRPACATRA